MNTLGGLPCVGQDKQISRWGLMYPWLHQPHTTATVALPPASSHPHSKLQEKDFQCRTLAAEKLHSFSLSPDRQTTPPSPTTVNSRPDPFVLPPQTVNKSNSSNKTTHIAQHVSRIRLELAPPRLRQGRSLVVRIHNLDKTPPPSLRGAKEKGKRNDFEENYRDSHEKTTDGKDGDTEEPMALEKDEG